jgi:hypothetical protein
MWIRTAITCIINIIDITAYINRGITIAPSTLAEAFKLCALLHFMVLDNILLITGVIKFL